MALTLTNEQKAIVSTNDRKVVIKAGAGASKTTSLVEYAKAHPKERILYLAYNKAIKEEADGRFPANVNIKTSHGAAMSEVGKYFSHKLTDSLRPQTVIEALGLDKRLVLSTPIMARYAKKIVDIINRYLASTDEDIGHSHLQMNLSDPIERQNFKPFDLLAHANEIWDKMTNPDDHSVPMLHDGYLKIFMLEKISIGRYDRILFDEGQDANPVTLQILVNQNTPFILVGDNNQSIYGFRGAVDALQQFSDATEYRLSGSFRFGPEIAMAANRILLLKSSDDFIRGVGNGGQVLLQEREDAWRNLVGENERIMYLARGAFNLFAEAIIQAKLGRKISFCGDIKSYRFSRLDDIYKLFKKGIPADPFLRKFQNYEDLKRYAVNDIDMEACCRLVEHYPNDLPEMIKLVQKATTENQDEAQILMSTAHKSKGLEMDTVVLSEDFKGFSKDHYFGSSGEPKLLRSAQDVEEANVVYVAITRAKNKLILPFNARILYENINITRQLVAQVASMSHMQQTSPEVERHMANRRARSL
ncbi:UvrD-helicase domain-containing protein [Methylobacillus sp. Pita2]|uniref:UvrD-helicase domain-containing protein n=1 Tax=Methylobacillus sp. Pita2 TaxID=3383245 RepID=UPI0038B4EEDC